jgi:hypothetical protein
MLLNDSQHAEDERVTGELDTMTSSAPSHRHQEAFGRQKNCYAGDVAIVDNHTAVTHASFIVT